MSQLTDAELICGFMEPRPELPLRYSHLAKSPNEWWVLGPVHGGGKRWYPVLLNLDRLHEVEARLTDEQWATYHLQLWARHYGKEHPTWRFMLHATADQKIQALAAVLRESRTEATDGK